MTKQAPATSATGVMTFVPLSQIDVEYNPRQFFDEQGMIDLTDNIRLRGVLQPILLRPSDTEGRYKLVAGERRTIACRAALGDDGVIPAIIRNLSDDEAIAAAMNENEVRQDVSETEQADAAVRYLNLCNGDRAEASRRLGWSITKLNRRMELSKLSEASKKALNERRILLGHAELLAATPPEKQDQALGKIIENNISVQQTRDLLTRMSHKLECAIFDRAECQSCQFNSTLQKTLFETTVFDGACTNPICYDLKTEKEQARLDDLAAKKAEQAVVETPDTAPAAANNTIAESSDDSHNTTTGNEEPEENDQPSEHTATNSPSSAGQAQAPSPTPASSKKNEDAKQTDEQIRESMIRKVTSIREKNWRIGLARHVSQHPGHAIRILTFAAYSGTLGNLTTATLDKRSKFLIGESILRKSAVDGVNLILNMEQEAIVPAFSAIAAAWVKDSADFKAISELCQSMDIDIRPFWTVTEDFIENFQKSQMVFLAKECGLVEFIGEKAFGKIASGNRDGLKKALSSTPNFNWAGKLPSSMTLSGQYEPALELATPSEKKEKPPAKEQPSAEPTTSQEIDSDLADV